MTKPYLTLLLLFLGVFSAFSQSTFTLLPKFNVGDTLTYEFTGSSVILGSEEPTNPSKHVYDLIVKDVDANGNFKIDYVLKAIDLAFDADEIKEMPFLKQFAEFYTKDMLRLPIHLTVERSGKLAKIDNAEEITTLCLKKVRPTLKKWAEELSKEKITDEAADSVIREKWDNCLVSTVFEEIPAMFKYYGKPLMYGRSQTVDSVTTNYTIAKMDDGGIWLKTKIDMMKGKDGESVGSDLAMVENEEGSEGEDELDYVDITFFEFEDYKFLPNGLLKFLSYKMELGSGEPGENAGGMSGKTTLTLLKHTSQH